MSATSGSVAANPEHILQTMWGYGPPLILEAAIELGVFDLLDSGPKTAEEVAAQTGASVRGIRSIMNALVGLQFLARNGGNRYELTPDSAAFLVSSKPGYLGGMFHHTSRQLIPNWLGLSEVVRTGRPAGAVNQKQTGAEFFQKFVSALFSMNYHAAQVLANALAVERAQTPVRVLDIAAGSGVWGIAIAQQSPNVSVTAVDWPEVLETTRSFAERFGMAQRFSYIAGDLDTVAFGQGYNVATLGHILHSEGERRSRALLRKTFEALAPGGTIAIAEFLVNHERTGPPTGLLFTVNMLVHTEEGDTYSFEEIRGWLEEAGFVNARTLDAGGHSPLILADKR